jgi:hypothetical protein
MRFRKLRIAWSVACGIACVLLIVLWVRSCFHVDEIRKDSSVGVRIVVSGVGQLAYMSWDTPSGMPRGWSHVTHDPLPDIDRTAAFGYRSHGNALFINAPYYPFVFASGVLAIVPWISQLRWRFSLRTLLIATTLVAVALGLIVWSTNSVELHTLGGPSRIVNEHGRLIEK